MAQIVARVVLAQAVQAVPDIALWCHRFKPQAQIARIAIAQHLRAAGIAGQIAANGATAFAAHAQRKQAARIGRSLLHVLQNTARFYRHSLVGYIHLPNAVEAQRAHHHAAATGIGCSAAYQSGIAALRHNRHMGCRAGAHHGGYLIGIGRKHHRQRLAMVALAPVGYIRGGVSACANMWRAQRLRQGVKQRIHRCDCLKGCLMNGSRVNRSNGCQSHCHDYAAKHSPYAD